ncbi:hypothetical protein ACFQ36_16420 [Arthrobacter sp. GCM10027362]
MSDATGLELREAAAVAAGTVEAAGVKAPGSGVAAAAGRPAQWN